MKITILAVGKIKETYFTAAVQEYAKRLNRYCKLEIIEVADEKTPDKASAHEEELIREKEGERLLKYLRGDAYVIALAIQGKQTTSEGFADKINRLGITGKSHIVFVIGGSIGLSPKVLQRAEEWLSFSEMTFPHQLMRVVLLEQIYRSYRIINGEPYHK
jgi:23S rRNA (pseudouridine1915-N3)-methyltransferase